MLLLLWWWWSDGIESSVPGDRELSSGVGEVMGREEGSKTKVDDGRCRCRKLAEGRQTQLIVNDRTGSARRGVEVDDGE